MSIEGALTGLHTSADHSVILRVYTTSAKTVAQDASGWTVVLDIRDSDRASAARLSVTGVVSGSFNSSPALNTQIVTFTVPKALLLKAIFKTDDLPMRHSFWRTDTGSAQPLRYGDCTVTRTTQAT